VLLHSSLSFRNKNTTAPWSLLNDHYYQLDSSAMDCLSLISLFYITISYYTLHAWVSLIYSIVNYQYEHAITVCYHVLYCKQKPKMILKNQSITHMAKRAIVHPLYNYGTHCTSNSIDSTKYSTSCSGIGFFPCWQPVSWLGQFGDGVVSKYSWLPILRYSESSWRVTIHSTLYEHDQLFWDCSMS
jgi:hypothetical protein